MTLAWAADFSSQENIPFHCQLAQESDRTIVISPTVQWTRYAPNGSQYCHTPSARAYVPLWRRLGGAVLPPLRGAHPVGRASFYTLQSSYGGVAITLP